MGQCRLGEADNDKDGCEERERSHAFECDRTRRTGSGLVPRHSFPVEAVFPADHELVRALVGEVVIADLVRHGDRVPVSQLHAESAAESHKNSQEEVGANVRKARESSHFDSHPVRMRPEAAHGPRDVALSTIVVLGSPDFDPDALQR